MCDICVYIVITCKLIPRIDLSILEQSGDKKDKSGKRKRNPVRPQQRLFDSHEVQALGTSTHHYYHHHHHHHHIYSNIIYLHITIYQ
jgi:hypothetical protein